VFISDPIDGFQLTTAEPGCFVRDGVDEFATRRVITEQARIVSGEVEYVVNGELEISQRGCHRSVPWRFAWDHTSG
jgi:hypothetical protein